VTASNSAGPLTVAATPVTVRALRPVLGAKVAVRIDSHETSSPNPTITPHVGFGGKNACTSGRWVHYPTKYAYYWYASSTRDPAQSGKSSAPALSRSVHLRGPVVLVDNG